MAFLHTIPYDGGESTSKPPALPHLGTSSTTATVPRRSIAATNVNRRLHMCVNRKLHSSKLFGRSWPSYTPYHYGGESRPPNLLLCLIWEPLRLELPNYYYEELRSVLVVVLICMPIANKPCFLSWGHLGRGLHNLS